MLEISNILEIENYIDDVDAVVFDLDDTLYSEKEYIRSGYHKVAEWMGIPEIETKLWDVFCCGGKSFDEVLEEQHRDEALRIYRFQRPDIHLYSGVNDMLKRIRNKKRIGIITDGRPEGQRAKIVALELEQITDEIIITDELGGVQFRKPNDISFRIIQNRFGVPFERIVYIGDNLKKDFLAPKNLGMKYVYFKNKDGLYL